MKFVRPIGQRRLDFFFRYSSFRFGKPALLCALFDPSRYGHRLKFFHAAPASDFCSGAQVRLSIRRSTIPNSRKSENAARGSTKLRGFVRVRVLIKESVPVRVAMRVIQPWSTPTRVTDRTPPASTTARSFDSSTSWISFTVIPGNDLSTRYPTAFSHRRVRKTLFLRGFRVSTPDSLLMYQAAPHFSIKMIEHRAAVMIRKSYRERLSELL